MTDAEISSEESINEMVVFNRDVLDYIFEEGSATQRKLDLQIQFTEIKDMQETIKELKEEKQEMIKDIIWTFDDPSIAYT